MKFDPEILRMESFGRLHPSAAAEPQRCALDRSALKPKVVNHGLLRHELRGSLIRFAHRLVTK